MGVSGSFLLRKITNKGNNRIMEMMKISEKLDQLSWEFNSQLEYEREKLNESYVSALINLRIL